MKHIFFFIATLLLSTSTLWASVYFWSNGLRYEICPNQHVSIVECSGCPTSITIPSSVTYSNTTYRVTEISYRAFADCSRLTSITIPNSVTGILKRAFANCSGLTSITIPDSVVLIHDSIFDGCSGLTSVTWNAIECKIYSSSSEYNTKSPFGSACQNIRSVTFGNKVQKIPPSLCQNMSCLTSITIPNSVKQIGVNTFKGCEYLEEVTLGTGIEEIGAYAFEGDKRIYSVTCYANVTPTIYESTFADVSSNAELLVPANVLKKYKVDEYWNKFTILPIQAENTENGTLTIRTTESEATITWPVNNNAETYTIVLKKEDATFCTLLFNYDGQLATIRFAAPAHDGKAASPAAELTTNGYRFTITGLDAGTKYSYAITTKDFEEAVLNNYEGTFTTKGGQTAIDEPYTENSRATQKVIRNGQLLIQNGEKVYTVLGVEL